MNTSKVVVRKGQFYQYNQTMQLDPGTNLVNQIYAGGKFEIEKVTTHYIDYRYTNYGKFTGKLDSLNKKRFLRLLHERAIISSDEQGTQHVEPIKKATYWRVLEDINTMETCLKGTKSQIEFWADIHKINVKDIKPTTMRHYKISSNTISLVSLSKSFLNQWMIKHKITLTDTELLLEAYRRYHMFEKPKKKPLDKSWVGLGGEEYVKSTHFKKANPGSPLPTWFCLTQSGIKIITDLNKRLPWETEYNSTIFDGGTI